jgi:hypothetical protein
MIKRKRNVTYRPQLWPTSERTLMPWRDLGVSRTTFYDGAGVNVQQQPNLLINLSRRRTSKD